MGLPFFTLGYLIHDKKDILTEKISNSFLIAFGIFGLLLTILKVIVVGKLDVYIGTIIVSVCIFIWCVKNPDTLNFKITELKVSDKLVEKKPMDFYQEDQSTPINYFKEEDFGRYDEFLSELREIIKRLYLQGYKPQCNLLTDRIDLDAMNNCNAGIDSITLAPDGNLYLCPGFYYDGEDSVGNLDDGINIKNQQLLRLDHLL